MRLVKRFKRAVLGVVGLCAIWSNAPAQGQLEEVVVTARRVEESLEDVPISISALTTQDIENYGIHDTQEVAQFVPNISMEHQGERTHTTAIYIRGVGGGHANQTDVQAGVGIYVDGMYMPRVHGGYTATLDIERIEVLRGPQGTLFGKNTIGGAINIVSAKPQPDISGRFGLRFGDYNLREVTGMVNAPLSDTLYARFSGVAELRDGPYEEAITGIDYGNRRVFAGRGALRFVPSDEFTFDVAVDYSHRPERGSGSTCIWNYRGRFQALYEFATGESFRDACNGSWDTLGDRAFASDVDGESITENYGVIAQASWTPPSNGFFDDREFKVIAGFRGQEHSLKIDGDASAARLRVTARDKIEQWQRSIEAQFIASKDRLSLTSGFYWSEDGNVEGSNDCRDELRSIGLKPNEPWSAGNASVDCLNAGMFQFHIVPDLPVVRAGTQVPGRIETYSLYANANYDLTDQLNLTVGARQTWEERWFSRFQVNNIRFDYDQKVVPLNEENFAFWTSDEGDWSELTPTVSLSYGLPAGGDGGLDSGNIYFTYAQGFKSGGFNTEFPAEFLGDNFFYEPEFADSYEIGLKSTWFDGRMRLNLALFRADYTDLQVSVGVENVGQFETLDPALNLIENAAAMEADGLELDLSLAPTNGLLINFAFGTLDAKFTEYFSFDPVQNMIINAVDTRPNHDIPEQTGSAFIQQTFNFPNGGTLTPRINGSYKGNFERDSNNRLGTVRSAIFQDAFTVWDARLSWSSADGDINLTGYVTNLTDEEHFVSGTSISRGPNGYTNVILGLPRMWGVQLQWDF